MKRSEIVGIRVTSEEKKEILSIAKAAGKDPSEYIRNMLLGAEKGSEEKRQLDKYEDDLLYLTINNTMLLRHITDGMGKLDFIQESQDLADEWMKKRYRKYKD